MKVIYNFAMQTKLILLPQRQLEDTQDTTIRILLGYYYT